MSRINGNSGMMGVATRVLVMQALSLFKTQREACEFPGIGARTMYGYKKELGIGESREDRDCGPYPEDMQALKDFLEGKVQLKGKPEPEPEPEPMVQVAQVEQTPVPPRASMDCWKCRKEILAIRGEIFPQYCPNCSRPVMINS